MRVIISGASGFVGRSLLKAFSGSGVDVVALYRSNRACPPKLTGIQSIYYDFVDGEILYSSELTSADYFFHLAGVAHKTNISEERLQPVFSEVNVALTLAFARSSQRLGVSRFIFVSSIGVLGESSRSGVLTASSMYAPTNAYSRSKMEAEVKLKEWFEDSGPEVLVLRPPLIFGLEAPGNLKRLIKLCAAMPILPFGGFLEPRAMISLRNFIDFLVHSVSCNLESQYECVIVGDGAEWSTSGLIELVREEAGLRCLNLRVPKAVVEIFFRSIGRHGDYKKLSEPLKVDASDIRDRFKWSPKFEPEEEMRASIRNHFAQQ